MKEITSLYIHFPYCQEICNYCDFFKKCIDGRSVRDFEQSLEVQAQKMLSFLSQHEVKLAPLKTLYIGGGTPSLWDSGPDYLDRLFEKYGWELDKEGEFTLEINPENFTQERFTSWNSWGINRFSIGVQSCNDEILRRLNRQHRFSDIKKCLEFFTERDLNFSMDLMLNLPSEGERDLERELLTLLSFNPKHLSVYIMTVGSNYKYAHLLKDDRNMEKEYLLVANCLKEQGFEHYEISNFAQTGFYSRHNMAYWKAKSVAALGSSATGFINLGQRAIRYKWLVSRDEMQIEKLSSEELLLEEIYLGLRTNRGISKNLLAQYIGEEGAGKISRFIKASRYADTDELILNSRGFLMLDSIMDEIFKY